MIKWRALAPALATAGALAVSAPVAGAAVSPASLTFGAGTVDIQDVGATSNTVRFTMHVTNPNTTRLFIDIHGLGHSRIALGNPAALGAPHAVYNDVSTDGCQVYTGTTFGEADEVASGDPNTIIFDIRKDELAPTIALAMEDSAAGGLDCRGFDGVSLGRPVSFATDGQSVTGLDWQPPADATGLGAIPGPHAITLVWLPPADALGVRYEISELQPDGTFLPFDTATGSSFTIDNLTPGVPHSYKIQAFRFWGGPMRSVNVTGPVTSAAVEFAAPASGGTTPVTVPGATTKPKTAAKAGAKRPATPRSWKAKVRGRRVVFTLPKLGKGQRFEIMRAAKTKYRRIATTTRRSYTDRKVRRGATYRYRLVLVSAAGVRSLPSKTIVVRVPRR